MKKKEKLGRKLLSFLLTLAMVVGLMPGMGLTAYAETLDNESTIWSENSVIAGDVTINNNVTVNADITLTIPEGKTLTINGQSDYVSYAAIYCDNNSILTVSGGGTLIVNAPAEEDGHPALVGFDGNLIVDGATVQVTGGAQGVYGNVTVKSGSVCVNGGNGEAGDNAYDGISGVVIVNGGSITVVGGNGGNGDNGDGGSGGDGVIGDVIVNGGSATITGGNGGTKGSSDYASNGYFGQAVYGSITGNAEESEDNTNWTSVTGSTSEKQYIKIEHILVTGVTLDKTTTQIIDEGNKVSFTATVAPDNAFDKTVKWSVGGTNATAVKLYSDENCTTEVGTDATSTLTVYAKGISAGNATVTCTSNADSTKSASCDVTVNAYAGNPYASLVNTTTSVKFNDMDWYIIADDSTAVDAGTVTLLSKDPIGASKFHESEYSVYVYSISLVKDYLDSLTGTGGTFEAVADAIVTVKVKGSDSDSEVDAKLWLLSTSEAEGLSEDVRKCSTAMSYFWWLRSRGLDPYKAARVYCEEGEVSGSGDNAWYEFGVRPALKLDLSKVTFDSSNKIFELMPVVEYPLWVGGVQVTSANKDDVLGDTDEGATVSYDVDTNTLTLNGVDIAKGYEVPDYNSTSGIYYSGNDSLSIVLSADSDNKVGVTGNVQIGIESSRNITISGAGKLTVKGSGDYSVGIEAYALTIKDAEINVGGAFNGIQTQKYGYGVNIISGKVNAIGQTGTGIHSGLRDVNYQTSAVTIGENATVVAIGGNKAINYLKNAIAGTGWTDPEDNTSKTTISINSEGQSIDTLKKMAFPELPASTVTTAPEAKALIYTGSALELVTAGEADGGTMNYAVSTNSATAPSTGWSTSIPTATNAGTYYVWYKVVGDSTHTDTEPVSITVTIANRPSTPYVPYVPSNPAPAPASEAYTVPVSNENTVDISVNISEGNAVVQEITQADLDKITDDTSGSGSDGEKKTDDTKISVDVSGAKSEVTSVELSGISVETLAKTVEENERVDSVEIKLTNATVELDSAAVSAISEQKEGNTIKLVVENKEQTKLNETQKESLKSFTSVKPFQAYFESGGKEIHDFKGGKATVSIKFSPEAGRDAKYYHVYYVPLSGLIERYVTRYLNGWFSYTTSHFSDYAIVYDATMENETGKEDVTPSPSPSTAPSASPSVVPSASPSPAPSASTEPSVAPSASVEPSTAPSTVPSQAPSEGKTGPVTAQEQAQAVLDINAGLKVVHNGTSASVQWGKVDGAKYYKVYAAYCGSKYKMIKTVDAVAKCKVTIKKLNGKKLSTTKNIKVYVAAYRTVETKNGEAVTKKDVRIAKTIAGHVVGKKNTKYSNAKKIKLSKTSYTLKKGKKVKIKAKTVLQYPKRKQLGDAHAKEFRYATSDKSIATVSKSGKITAKKKGSCVIYVYARNGLAKKVKVTVK